jgi:DNA-binding MltR family transcriptional regulator
VAKIVDLDFPDYHAVVKNYHSESDRAAAVLAGSYLENQLGLFIKSVTAEDKNKNEWFAANGPFATFDQRITAAYAFKLIPEYVKNNFNNIRDIRNRFAHHPTVIDFDDNLITDRINKLNVPDNLIPEIPISKRDKYLIAISLAVSAMQSYINKRKKANDDAPSKP